MLPLVEIDSPDPRERGRQYGEQARDRIAASVEFYKGEFARKSGMTWDDVRSGTPQWVPLIEAYHAEALEETRGIADGSGFSFEEILALNGRGELRVRDPFGGEGCTSFALTADASGDGHVYCGQNWDWRVGTKESVVMLRIKQPPKPTIVIQVEAGQVGRHGANSAGIGLNANGLAAPFGFSLGVPAPYIRRRILDSTTMHDALAAVMEAKQSVCSNLLFTHRDGYCVDLETTPERHGVMEPSGGMLVHANAFIAHVPAQIEDSYRPYAVDSLFRAPRVEGHLRRARDAGSTAETREVIAGALADHFSYPNSVCTHPDPRDGGRWETLASTIVDLTSGEYLVAPGNPCEEPHEALPWNLYDDA
jgi:isopenicillin-N N-acyltransferase-like protein